MIIMQGYLIANEIQKELLYSFAALEYQPKLAIIQIGENRSSDTYVSKKIEFAKYLQIDAKKYFFYEDIEYEELKKQVINIIDSADGVLFQMPLPKKFQKHCEELLDLVPWQKDVDGLCRENIKRFKDKREALVPATAVGVLVLLKKYHIEIKDKIVCVIGESDIVGLPVAELMRREGGKVYTLNSSTGVQSSEMADILISAAGKIHIIKSQNVKKKAVVIDVGFTHFQGKIYGDVDFEDVKWKISHISKVPGGVGPITVACLMQNFLQSLKIQEKIS